MQDEGAIQCQGVRRGRRARALGPCAAVDSRWAVSPSGHQGPLYQHFAWQPGACTCPGCFRHSNSFVRGVPWARIQGSEWSSALCLGSRKDAFVRDASRRWGTKGDTATVREDSGGPDGQSRMRVDRDRATPTASEPGLGPVFPAFSREHHNGSLVPVRRARGPPRVSTPTANRSPPVWPICSAPSGVRLGERQTLCPDVPAWRLIGT